MKQFEIIVDQFGNLLINKGFVIDLSAATTAFYELGETEETTLINNPLNGTRTIDTDRLFFLGGSGRSMEFAGTLTDSSPLGYYAQEDEFDWAKRNFTIIGTPATGAEMSDGTNIVATITGAFTTSPAGTWNSTTYGKNTYNGGTPFTLTATGGGGGTVATTVFTGSSQFATKMYQTSPETWEGNGFILTVLEDLSAGYFEDGSGSLCDMVTPYNFDSTLYGETNFNGGTPFTMVATFETSASTITTNATSGTVQTGNFIESAWLTWTSEDDADFTVTVNNDGTADLSDATNIIASRSDLLIRQPQGVYQSTTYGADTYNNGAAFIFTIGNAPAVPQYAYVWVEIELLSGAFVGATGPFIGSSLPANSATLEVCPIGFSNGSGVVKQIHDGPIIWK